jgi:hypothetical protein
MCANTCPNEQNILAALRLETPEEVPSFCQSIMSALHNAYMQKYEDDLEDDQILFTDIGDFTIYRCFGYSSHWSGGPQAHIKADDAIREKVAKMTEEVQKKHGPEYSVTEIGSIRKSNNVTHWFVEAGIKSEEDLRFFLDHWKIVPPTPDEIERWRLGRLQCMEADFVPFISNHVVVEPANQIIDFGLTGKLMRKENPLIDELYDFLVQIPILSFKAAASFGAKCYCTADDCAYKSGPMFSPKYYRKYVTPRAKQVCDVVREADGVIFMHTDGYIDPIMDCFIDAGYHAIQPLEPTSMGYDAITRVKKQWGDKLAVVGNCDTTNTLSFKTPEEVRQEVHSCFRQAKGDSDKISGYMFAASGSLHDKVQLENALAMMDEYKKIRNGTVPI